MPRLLPSIFFALLVLTSCTKDPVVVVVPDTIVSYSVTDTMRLTATTVSNYPELFTKYNNKTYSRETNKVTSNYKVEGTDVLIIFEDTSVANFGTELILKIPNKTLSTISGNYSAQTQEVFYKWTQRTSASSGVFSVGYTKADTGAIQITYDDKTKTLSGTITKLKYPFGVYVPYYLPGSAMTTGSTDALFLTSGGSFRQHTISFQYAKSL